MEGTTAVVGAPGELANPGDPNSAAVGAVYVYARGAAGWQEVQRLLPPAPQEGAQFGASVSLSGGVLVVGAPTASGDSGQVYLFTQHQGVFTLAGVLDPTSTVAGGRFGGAVVVRGSWLAIGAAGDSEEAEGAGAVYVYEQTGAGWASRGQIRASVPEPGGQFGWSVDIENGRVVVGGLHQAAGFGQVFVFEPGTAGWEEKAVLSAPEPQGDAGFGYAVSLEGDVLVAGAPYQNASVGRAGAVAVFRLAGGRWEPLDWFGADDANLDQEFGAAVQLRHGLLVVGAPGDGQIGNTVLDRGGAVYTYALGAGGVTLQSELGASTREDGERFGSSLALDGQRLVVGSPFKTLLEAGGTAVFEVNTPPVADASRTPTVLDSANGVDVAVTLDGSLSSDPDGDALTYHWSAFGFTIGTDQLQPARLGVGYHTVTLSVSDGLATAETTVEITVNPPNQAPVARLLESTLEVTAAGPAGATVTLDGSASWDPDGDPLQYAWSESGQTIATGVAPQVLLVPGTHAIVLTVTDGRLSDSVTLTVTVRQMAGENQPPVADASRTITRVIAANGCWADVVLDGSRSSDPDGDVLTHRWFEGQRLVAEGAVVSVQLPVGVHGLRLEVWDGASCAEAHVALRVLTPVQAVRVLALKVQASELPRGKKMVALALLRAAERAFMRGKITLAAHHLRVFEIVLANGRTERSVAGPLIAEARWIRKAVE